MRWPAAVVALVVVALAAAAGCLSPQPSDGEPAAAVPSSIVPVQVQVPAGTGPIDATATDLAQAHAVVLKLSDLGATWTAIPRDTAGAMSGAAQLYECLGIAPDALSSNRAASADSDTFSTNLRGVQVQNSVVVGKSVSATNATFDLLAGPSTPACLDEVVRTKLGAATGNVQFGSVSTAVLEFAPVADRTFSVRTTIGVTQGSVTLDLYADSVFVLRGRVTCSFFFLSALAPLDQSFELQVVGIVTNRTK